MQLIYVLGNCYDLYKYHYFCTNKIDQGMIERSRLKNFFFIQTILSFVLSRKESISSSIFCKIEKVFNSSDSVLEL